MSVRWRINKRAQANNERGNVFFFRTNVHDFVAMVLAAQVQAFDLSRRSAAMLRSKSETPGTYKRSTHG